METGKTSLYFPHDCDASDDPKIMLMIAQMGLEAYGIYWILIEYLRKQTGYIAPMILLDPLSRRYGSSKEKFEAIVTKFELFEFDNMHFSSPSLCRRMVPVDERKQHYKALAQKRWDNDAGAMRTHSASNAQAMQRREENRRVNKRKEEKNKGMDLSFVHPDFLPVWEKWMDYKRKIGKTYKVQESMERKYHEMVLLSSNDPVKAMMIVENSIKEQWTGFYPLKASQVKEEIPGEDPVQKNIRLIKDSLSSQS